jgi:hypothetical protein
LSAYPAELCEACSLWTEYSKLFYEVLNRIARMFECVIKIVNFRRLTYYINRNWAFGTYPLKPHNFYKPTCRGNSILKWQMETSVLVPYFYMSISDYETRTIYLEHGLMQRVSCSIRKSRLMCMYVYIYIYIHIHEYLFDRWYHTNV